MADSGCLGLLVFWFLGFVPRYRCNGQAGVRSDLPDAQEYGAAGLPGKPASGFRGNPAFGKFGLRMFGTGFDHFLPSGL